MRQPVITVRRNSSKSRTLGWKARLTVTPDAKLKGRTVEIGLGTRSEAEAIKKAEIIARAMFAAGFIPKMIPVKMDNRTVSRFEQVDKKKPEQLLLNL